MGFVKGKWVTILKTKNIIELATRPPQSNVYNVHLSVSLCVVCAIQLPREQGPPVTVFLRRGFIANDLAQPDLTQPDPT